VAGAGWHALADTRWQADVRGHVQRSRCRSRGSEHRQSRVLHHVLPRRRSRLSQLGYDQGRDQKYHRCRRRRGFVFHHRDGHQGRSLLWLRQMDRGRPESQGMGLADAWNRAPGRLAVLGHHPLRPERSSPLRQLIPALASRSEAPAGAETVTCRDIVCWLSSAPCCAPIAESGVAPQWRLQTKSERATRGNR